MSAVGIHNTAKAFLGQQLYSDTVSLLIDHLVDEPRDVVAWELIAVAYSKLGDWENALDAMEQVLHYRADRALSWAQYGMALRKTGDFEGARKAQVKALTTDPNLELGIIELRKIKRDQAGNHKKRKRSTLCPECGYAMSPNDRECPRCVTRRKEAENPATNQAIHTEQPTTPAVPTAPAMPYAPVPADVTEATADQQYTAKTPQPGQFDSPLPTSAPIPPYAAEFPHQQAQMPDAPQYAPDPAGVAEASTARIFSIVGLFFAGIVVGIVFGILAIVLANRAEARGVNASGSRTLGIVDIILGVAFLFLFPTFMAAVNEDTRTSANTSANAIDYGPSHSSQPVRTGQWTKVATWSGNGIKSTQTFQVSNEWAIEWATQPGQYGEMNFQIYIYSSDGQLADVGANIIGAGHDQSYYHKAGVYYLTINSAQPWQVIIWDKR